MNDDSSDFGRAPARLGAGVGHRSATACALLLFCSGACALIYQISWFRQFRYFFGNSTMASAAVMAVFMAGLGAGGLILGGVADRKRQPLRYYGILEMGVGILAAFSLVLMALAKKLYIGLGGIEALGPWTAGGMRLFLTFLVIGIPTFLMGGTLPAAVNAIVRQSDTARRGVGLLYGTNTLGAFAGGLATTFLLHERLGIANTLWLGVGLNLLTAAGALLLANTKLFPAVEVLLPSGAATTPIQGSGGLPPRWFVLTAASLVGFIFLLQEMVWYRMLAPILGGSTYTISLILCAALLGIGLGGALYPIFRKNRVPTLAGFAVTCALEAALLALPWALGDRLAVWASALSSASGSFAALTMGWSLILLVVVVPASVISGIQFPLLIALLGKGRQRLGREVGLAYIFNAVGAIVGAIAGGFGLMIVLSAPGTWRFAVWVLTGLSLAALAIGARPFRLTRTRLSAAVLIAITGLFISGSGPTAAWRHSGIGAGRSELETPEEPNAVRQWLNAHRREIVWELDGIESSIGISEAEGIKFIVNGKTDGNALTDAHTQVMGGLIGAALHPRPRQALVIGLGTGSTAGWLGEVPGMERVDVVELEPAVLHVAEACSAVNRRVLANPRVHLILGDAREFLLTTRRDYDLIFSEPSNPYRAGIASLYTREYYEAAADRLSDRGFFLQWLQGYSVDRTTVDRVYSTLSAVFPSVETWLTGNADLILAASKTERAYDLHLLNSRLANEPYVSALRAAWRVRGAEGFFSRYLANDRFAKRHAVFSGNELNTDDRTHIEFAMARSVGRGKFNPYALFLELKPRERLPRLTGDELDWELTEACRVNLLPEGFPIHKIAWPQGNNPAYKRTEALARYYGADRRSPDFPKLLDQAYRVWREQHDPPTKPDDWLLLSEWAALNGDPDALDHAMVLERDNPIEADVVRAMYHARIGELEAAGQRLHSAFTRYRASPWALLGIMEGALALAPWLGAQDKALGERLYRTLQEPFAVQALKNQRLLTLYQLALTLDFERYCREAIARFEPHLIWREDFLETRVTCFERTNDRNLEEARKDLARFRNNSN